MWQVEPLHTQLLSRSSWTPSMIGDRVTDAYVCVRGPPLKAVRSQLDDTGPWVQAQELSSPIYASCCNILGGDSCNGYMLGDEPDGSCAPLRGRVVHTESIGRCFRLDPDEVKKIDLKATPRPIFQLEFDGVTPQQLAEVWAKYEYIPR